MEQILYFRQIVFKGQYILNIENPYFFYTSPKGFNPKFFTHYWKDNKGDVYFFASEFGFLKLKKLGKENLFLWQDYIGYFFVKKGTVKGTVKPKNAYFYIELILIIS